MIRHVLLLSLLYYHSTPMILTTLTTGVIPTELNSIGYEGSAILTYKIPIPPKLQLPLSDTGNCSQYSEFTPDNRLCKHLRKLYPVLKHTIAQLDNLREALIYADYDRLIIPASSITSESDTPTVIDSTQHTSYRRTRRGLFDFVGEVNRFLFGIATEKQFHQLYERE